MKDPGPGRRGSTVRPATSSRREALSLALEGLLLFGFALGSSGPGVAAAQEISPQSAAPGAKSEKLEASIGEYEQLVKEHPESPEIWSNLGVLRAMAGRCKDALPALERAESLNATLANAWFFSGYCHSTLHQSRRAAASLERASRLSPKDPNISMLRAQVSADLGHMEDSLEEVVRAQTLGLKRPDTYYLAGKDALELAAGFYDRVTVAAPQPDLYAMYLAGQRNAAMGLWEPAIEEYGRALKIAPRQADLHFALGSVYLEMGQWRNAEASFRRALELSPGSTWVRLRLALALTEQSRREEALSVFRTVPMDDLVLPPEYQDYLACSYLLKLTGAAQAALAQAQRKFPYQSGWSEWTERLASRPPGEHPDASEPLKLKELTGVGLAFSFRLTEKPDRGGVFAALFPVPAGYQGFQSDIFHNRWAEAAAKIVPLLKGKQGGSNSRAFALGQVLQSLSYHFNQQLGSEFPDSTPAMRLAAENLASAGHPEKALEIYQAIVKRDGPSPDVLHEMARIYWADHKWDEAVQVLEPLAEMDPADATNFVNLGRVYTSQQKFDRASEAFRRALAIDPGMPEAHLGLGQALRSAGDFQGAVRELKAASQIDPLNPKPHYELSQVYSKLGDKQLAAEEMASFQHLWTTATAEARQRKGLLAPVD